MRRSVERTFWFRLALVVVSLSAIVYLVDALRRFWGFLGDVLLAIFLAWLVGSILLHIVNSLMRIPKMRRPLAIVIVYLALITLILDFAFLVLPATVDQVLDVAELLPALADNYLPRLATTVNQYVARFGLSIEVLSPGQLESLSTVVDAAGTWAQENAIQILGQVFSALFLTGLVIVLSFYFVLDGGRRLNESLKVLPLKAEREVRFVLRTIDETFYGYVRGMLVISLLYGIVVSSVMMLTGLPAALPTGIISAVLLAVPFVGDWLALILPSLIAAIAGDFPVTLIIVFGVLLFFQQVMLSALTPRILGQAVRMPAMIVVVAVVLGARVAGIPGALMGVPVSAVIYTLSTHYGMRIRRAREAREAEALAKAEGLTLRPRPAPETPASRPARPPEWEQAAQPMPAAGGSSDEEEYTDDFEEQLLDALDEAYDMPGPTRPRTRPREEPA